MFEHYLQQTMRTIRSLGFQVVIESLPFPNTGDFDGATLKVHNAIDTQTQLWVLLHIFGHCVQWLDAEEWYQFGLRDFRAEPVTPELMQQIRIYEENASRLGLSLLHNAGIHELDQWLSDWFAADWRYLSAVYEGRTTVDPFDHFQEKYWRKGSPLLVPLPIPDVAPRTLESRRAF